MRGPWETLFLCCACINEHVACIKLWVVQISVNLSPSAHRSSHDWSEFVATSGATASSWCEAMVKSSSKRPVKFKAPDSLQLRIMVLDLHQRTACKASAQWSKHAQANNIQAHPRPMECAADGMCKMQASICLCCACL